MLSRCRRNPLTASIAIHAPNHPLNRCFPSWASSDIVISRSFAAGAAEERQTDQQLEAVAMWDAIVLSIGATFSLLTWLLLALCDSLKGGRP
jgi:hypothetical protein